MPICKYVIDKRAFTDPDGQTYCTVERGKCRHDENGSHEGHRIEYKGYHVDFKGKILILCKRSGLYGTLTDQEKQENAKHLTQFYDGKGNQPIKP